MAEAWRALADELMIAGDSARCGRRLRQSIRASTQDPELLAAAAALCENQIPEAEAQLRQILRRRPKDVAACACWQRSRRGCAATGTPRPCWFIAWSWRPL